MITAVERPLSASGLHITETMIPVNVSFDMDSH